ncbi:hypothetical protein [Cesiribacter andamanensis]|uniref:Quinol:cytochrome C oxidoreductase n=1 Tax=Cesiribacter andamanensis AMV16 TaxID=1279009 RepID=M7NMN6_9BACT|nr:hypothetical protein [Cesiribacter andamanensis]EMR03035.1 hypothetical protein ADICEAN_01829 [Cesiribacter andamanensis AMV16]
MEHPIHVEERYRFTAGLKKVLGILLVVGVVLLAVGLFFGISGSGAHHHAEDSLESPIEAAESPVDGAVGAQSGALETLPGQGGEDSAHPRASGNPTADAAHDDAPVWRKQLFSNIWINNVFFTGLAIIGLFFVAIQYAAQAGWSASIIRVPLAMASWLPIAGVLMLVTWLIASHDLFHWTHESLYDVNNPDTYDPIIDGKKGYLNPVFYLARMVIFFAIWILFFFLIRRTSMEEDLHGGTSYWYKLRKHSAIFLVLFAVSSSMAAWDWVMSIDPHWFSTLFGWYVFASWWVSGLAAITLIVIFLREAGYMKIVNSNHLHDLGKFIFAFSIFWTYLWFSQFLLIYYANIPEESIYYIERLTSDYYSPVFFINLILNFFFPFLVLMTRDAKRHTIFLKIVCAVVLFGHWLDFYLMVTPGVMKDFGGFGLIEVGLILIYASAFGFVVMTSLSKMGLIPKHHPMLQESIHHHI